MYNQHQEEQIDITYPTEEFKRHLALKNNQRIIFSGPFGSGKTYFLKQFFNDKEKYACIRLAPVNYSVAQNEDVFELIKFDILFQLLEEDLFQEDIEMSKALILRHSSLLDPHKGIVSILEKADKTGKNTLEIFTELQSVLNGGTEKFIHSENLNDINYLNGSLQKIIRSRGGIYENNVLTQLLYYLVSKIGSDKKETVLLIDDLDRMDPEHIFRILNVFAAHFDIDAEENKFGFDRVLLVCDLENVRKVFSSRYGQDTDFNGYVDKFYSKEVFCFDNSKAVKDAISKVICSINIVPQSDLKIFPFNDTHGVIYRFILYILIAFIQVGATNLRSIQRARGSDFYIQWKEINKDFETHQFTLIWILDFIRMIIGDGTSVFRSIQKCVAAKVENEIIFEKHHSNQDILGIILPVFRINNNVQHEGNFIYNLDGLGITFHYQLKNVGPRMNIFWAEVNKIKNKENNEISNFKVEAIFAILLEAVKKIQLLGLIK